MKSQTDIRELAHELKDTLITISPFIEKHTAIVCLDCKKVCCADKHGRFGNDDIAFLTALEVDIPHQPIDREETAACRYMTETGCSLQRWMRPYRCTLFFCTPLLKSLEQDDPKLYRAFDDYFQHLISLRTQLTGKNW